MPAATSSTMATLLAASHHPRLLRFIAAGTRTRSTSVLMISVTTASMDSIEATANAPTKLYSL